MTRRRRVTALLAVVLAGLAACADHPMTDQGGHLDGETIFRGLILGEPRVAGLFPELWEGVRLENPDWTDAQRLEVLAVKADLIADMARADPSFFERFRAAMTSGNHVRITRLLDEGGTLFTAAVEAHAGDARLDTEDAAGLGIKWVVVVQVALAWVITFNVVLNVNAFANKNLVYDKDYFWSAHDQGGGSAARGSGLLRDQVVQLIATRLKGR